MQVNRVSSCRVPASPQTATRVANESINGAPQSLPSTSCRVVSCYSLSCPTADNHLLYHPLSQLPIDIYVSTMEYRKNTNQITFVERFGEGQRIPHRFTLSYDPLRSNLQNKDMYQENYKVIMNISFFSLKTISNTLLRCTTSSQLPRNRTCNKKCTLSLTG